MAEVKLIAASLSLFCARVEWALKLKGVEYESIEEDLENKSSLLLNSNPVYKQVPVLVHNAKPIAESLIILEYIDETWKDSPLLPQNPYDRAMARFWASFAEEKCLLGAYHACRAQGDAKEKAIETASESFAFLEKQLGRAKYFGGEKIGYLDLALGWIPIFLNVIEEIGCMKLVDAQRFPLLHQWGQDFIGTPLIKESLPPRQKLIEHLTAATQK